MEPQGNAIAVLSVSCSTSKDQRKSEITPSDVTADQEPTALSAHFPSATGALKKKVDPSPSVDSTHIRPPCPSMMFLQVASPIPEPWYLSWP
jgi:hypothetical protein